MKRTDTIIIGAGQAGLAMSRCLTECGTDHVLIERGRIGERWRSERWDSLKLLTPNWQSRLPGWSYKGPDPDGFMSMPQVVSHFERYAQSFHAPVQEETRVLAVDRVDDGYRVTTDQGTWSAPDVVIATGYSDLPKIPAMAQSLSGDVRQVTTNRYRNPSQIPDGGILVVGAAASGAQLADELRRSGRDIHLAVGAHTRLPRSYRGMDIMWWLNRIGSLDRTIDEVPDASAARQAPSLQLVGRDDHASLDLGILQDRGVQLAGRLTGIDGTRVTFTDDVAQTTASADRQLRKILSRIDRHVEETGLAAEVLDAEPIAPIEPVPGPTKLDLRAEGISTVLWATGYRRSYPWLHVPVTDGNGDIRQYRGRTPSPGMFVLGMNFQHRRKSTFIDGVGLDARDVAQQIAARHGRKTAVMA